jgi:hypothetical protein
MKVITGDDTGLIKIIDSSQNKIISKLGEQGKDL